jgi:membrane protease YdiL (CAAX protease family)
MTQAAMNEPVPVAPSPWLRILRNPLTRIVLFMAMAGLIGLAMRRLLPYPSLAPDKALAVTGVELWLRALRSLVPVALSYWLLVRFVEGRPVSELAPRKLARHVSFGWLVGMSLLLLAAIAMAAVGAYRIQGVNGGAYLLGPLVVLGLLPGITEEIIARGILFRVVEDGLGTWIALVFSALMFGAGHLANPNATVWSSAAIAIEAGLLLGMAYVWTRSLWFCMGLHAAWNFTQGPLLGIPVSGFDVDSLLVSSTQGPTLLSGGEFGAEASILTVIICVTVAGYFTRRAIDEGQLRVPYWRPARVYLVIALLTVVATALAHYFGGGKPQITVLPLVLGLARGLAAPPAPPRAASPVASPTAVRDPA